MQNLSDILRDAREKKGLSVKDVEKGTSIRAIYIQAIDEGNFSILPGEVYLKGFIRNYANFLGLNGQEMVNMYRQSQTPEVAPPVEQPKNERKRQAAKGGSGGKWLLAVVVIFLFAGAAWIGVSFLNNSPTPSAPPPKPAPQAQSVQPSPTPAAPTPAPSVVPIKPPTTVTPTARPLVIVAKYTEPSWTFVTADGKSIYEGIPKVGDTLTWSADRDITLKLGNAAGVNMTVNGQPQGKLGSDGEVLEKTYSAGAAATNIQKP